MDFVMQDRSESGAAMAQWPEPCRSDKGAASLLLVGGGDVPGLGSPEGLHIVGPVRPEAAIERLRDLARPEILLWRGMETLDAAMLAAIGAAIAERDCALICEVSLAALDRVVAAVPTSVRAEWLVDADTADRMAALAALRRPRCMTVGDVARDGAMERIDQLQEEVARIARLLGELAAPRGLPGTPMSYGERDANYADFAGQVRAPVRDYAAGPRGFLPEERAIDRQRAKAVRKMLRQRRMREQYFPADLFADPAWDMLLDLYAARLERQPVSVSSLCIAAAVPATTALRWIKTMTEAGLFVREADPHDGRRIFIALAEGTFDSLARYFEALEE